jgi:hypothetical protein
MSTSQATTTTKTPIVQPQLTIPGTTRTLSSGNDYNSSPVDWRVQRTGSVNSVGDATVQRSDVAYGQPGNCGDAVNTVTAGSDGSTTTATKTYNDGGVKIKKYESSSSSSNSSSSSSNSSGGANKTFVSRQRLGAVTGLNTVFRNLGSAIAPRSPARSSQTTARMLLQRAPWPRIFLGPLQRRLC